MNIVKNNYIGGGGGGVELGCAKLVAAVIANKIK